jgi:hypothetical protein
MQYSVYSHENASNFPHACCALGVSSIMFTCCYKFIQITE